ncbi:baseplate assembly protein [Paenibacillus harenae]|uniref:Phage-related baseplate assembly protein n=1 Tax=Paenibacillus harenae TaxID=306543 RepID=A0ABT9U3X7_PAEHA|nr:baseplate J/gp47 family protein [Paenibacillus harenae]MDQ0114349.1 phage-related baseplate assembly protein [Paenibacillus harenae]
MTALIDLSDIEFVSDDVTTTLNNLITTYEAISSRTVYPGDPVRLFLLTLASIIVQQRALINLTAKQNLLKYASGLMLDHMGAFSDTGRLPASSAAVNLRFTLSAPQTSAVTIPAGTRASTTSDPKRYFATTTLTQIAPGTMSADVLALCTEAGMLGNGFVAGQINQIVDPIAYVASVTNFSGSSGGADLEDDEAYRERIRSAPESFSVAGPSGAYKHWAKSASASIVDVAVFSPAACEVVVVPLLEGGEIPGQGVLDLVNAAINDRTRRPLSDLVTVQAPTAVSYTVSFTYWVSVDRQGELADIQTRVNTAVSAYVLWQKSKLGRNINTSELTARVMQAGAHRVSITSPLFAEIAYNEVAVASGVTSTYGGLTDD